MATINKHIYGILRERYHDILEGGEFPEVGFQRTPHGQTYMSFPYGENWSKFCRIVDKEMIEIGEEGVFTKKYNKVLLEKIQEIVDSIDAEQLKNQTERFRIHMWD